MQEVGSCVEVGPRREPPNAQAPSCGRPGSPRLADAAPPCRNGPPEPEKRRRLVPPRGGRPCAASEARRARDHQGGGCGRADGATRLRRRGDSAALAVLLGHRGAQGLGGGQGAADQRHRRYVTQRLQLPRYRGGPLFRAGRIGAGEVYNRISAGHQRCGARWAPSALLRKVAENGGPLRGTTSVKARQRSAAMEVKGGCANRLGPGRGGGGTGGTDPCGKLARSWRWPGYSD